jgi:hypothetical protein
MCGIAGFSGQFPRELLAQMNARISHTLVIKSDSRTGVYPLLIYLLPVINLSLFNALVVTAVLNKVCG